MSNEEELRTAWSNSMVPTEVQDQMISTMNKGADQAIKEQAGLIETTNDQAYMSDGDDYYIDDTALSDAQTSTGDNSTASSVSGSSSGTSETNSNVNTGVFGGLSKAAHPGYSLW